MKALTARAGGGTTFPSSADAVVFGHEFCA